jgi:hypothetical protein
MRLEVEVGMVMGVPGDGHKDLTFQAATFAAFFKKCVGFGLHPPDEAGHLFGQLQGLDRGVGARQFGFGEQCVNLAVANPVQHHRLSTPVRLGHQMVRVLLTGWNGAFAQWTPHLAAARCGQSLKLGLNALLANPPRHGGKTVVTMARGYNRPPAGQAAPGD